MASDIASISISEPRFGLTRYTIEFQAGDKLHATINQHNKALFESAVSEQGLTITKNSD